MLEIGTAALQGLDEINAARKSLGRRLTRPLVLLRLLAMAVLLVLADLLVCRGVSPIDWYSARPGRFAYWRALQARGGAVAQILKIYRESRDARDRGDHARV